jgi:hypothetical protein
MYGLRGRILMVVAATAATMVVATNAQAGLIGLDKVKGHDKGGLTQTKELIVDDFNTYDTNEALKQFDNNAMRDTLALLGTNTGSLARKGGDGLILAGTDSGSFAPVAKYGGRGAHAIEKPDKVHSVPEPGTLTMAGMGFIGLIASARRRRKMNDR